MAKYSVEFKLEVVKYYEENRCGYETTAKHFNVGFACLPCSISRFCNLILHYFGEKNQSLTQKEMPQNRHFFYNWILFLQTDFTFSIYLYISLIKRIERYL